MTELAQVPPDEWRLWRSLRLEALRESPTVFTASLAQWQGDGDDEGRWRRRLVDVECNLVARLDGVPVGMVSGARTDRGSTVVLTSLWVAPTTRGRGVGGLLVRGVLDWAATETTAPAVTLSVRPDNDPALRIYLREGFVGGAVDASSHLQEFSVRLPEKVRIGIHSGQQYADFGTVQALWRDAEQLGYDWVSLFDHFRPPIFGADGPCFDGPTLLAALAATTSRVRCALLVAPTVWRHPALAAATAATLDHVSGGRLEFGVGAGSADLAFAQYGISQPSLATRLEQLEEACAVMRLLWTGGPVCFAGEHYRLSEAYLNPRPLQRRLPLVVGGASIPVLGIAARHGDVWNSRPLPPEVYRRKAEALDMLCEAEGRAGQEIRRSVTFRTVLAPGTAAAARAAVAAGPHHPDLGEYVSFSSAQECLDALAPYVLLGVRDFLLGLRPPLDLATAERFACEVAPVLRGMAPR